MIPGTHPKGLWWRVWKVFILANSYGQKTPNPTQLSLTMLICILLGSSYGEDGHDILVCMYWFQLERYTCICLLSLGWFLFISSFFSIVCTYLWWSLQSSLTLKKGFGDIYVSWRLPVSIKFETPSLGTITRLWAESLPTGSAPQ